MFSRYISRLTKSIALFPTRFISQKLYVNDEIKSLKEEADFQLSSQNSIDAGLKTYKIATSRIIKYHENNMLQRCLWYADAAHNLSERGLVKESKEYLQETIHLFNQLDLSTNPSTYVDICYKIGYTYYRNKDFNNSEEYIMRCLNNFNNADSNLQFNILEYSMSVKICLNKIEESIRIFEEFVIQLDSINLSDSHFIYILYNYGISLYDLQDFEKALIAIQKCASIIESKENYWDKELEFLVYRKLFDVHFKMENEEEALKVLISVADIIDKSCGFAKAIELLETRLSIFKSFENSEVVVKKILSLGKKIEDISKIIRVYLLASDFYMKNNRKKESIEYCNIGLLIAKKWNNSESMLNCYCRLAKYNLDNPEISRTFIDNIKTLLESFTNEIHQRNLYLLEYLYYFKIKDYEKANSYLELEISRTPETQENAEYIINKYIGDCDYHFRLFRIEKSLKYLKTALKISEKYLPKNHICHAKILASFGLIYVESGDNEKAIEYFTEALLIFDEINEDDSFIFDIIRKGVIEIYYEFRKIGIGASILSYKVDSNNVKKLDIGRFFLVFGQICQKMAMKDKARTYYLKAIEIFTMLKKEDLIKDAEKLLNDIELSQEGIVFRIPYPLGLKSKAN